jgi:P4 family phage/plasmid primase-like protien
MSERRKSSTNRKDEAMSTLETVTVDRLAIREFLAGMYGFDAQGFLTPCWKAGAGIACEFVPAIDLETAVDVLARHAESRDTWIGVGTRRERLQGSARGGKHDVLALPSVWLDVDHLDAGHKGTDGLAADLAAANEIVAAMPVPPTVLIRTGGGVQAHWCFSMLIPVDDCPIDLNDLCEAWVRVAKSIATQLDAPKAVDSVGNIDRILRVPGTLNRKLEQARPIVILEANWDRRYTPGELDAHIPAGSKPSPTLAPAHHPPVAPVGQDARAFLDQPRPHDAFNERTDIAALIEADGATYAYTDSTGRRHYVRPDKDIEAGASGNILSNKLYVHSDAWVANGVPLDANRAYTPAQYITFTRFGGDFTAAARALAESAASASNLLADLGIDTSWDGAQREERLLVDSPAAPLPNAELFLHARYAHEVHDLLIHHVGAFETWTGVDWRPIEDGRLRSELYSFFKDAVFYNANGELRPFRPGRNKVSDLVDALKASTYLTNEVAPAAWLTDGESAPASELISMHNGLIHVPTRTLLAHTPAFYTTWSLPFAYNPDATGPQRWVQFLDELWPDDAESQQTLQDIFGYLLSGDTRQQKIFALIGQKRAGKGTIARVLTALIGTDNVAGPTVSSLSERFGLAPLLGRPLAILSDARLHSKNTTLVERLLAISGEDRISVDRKYVDAHEVRLPTRFLLISNETPRFTDSSGALASRFVMLHLTNTFYGREDLELDNTLQGELPGIFNWSLDGLDRLRQRGHFVQPASAQAIAEELEDLSSPVGAFVHDRCDIGPDYAVQCGLLHNEYRSWCMQEGIEPVGPADFGRELRTVVPGLHTPQRRTEGTRVRVFQGIHIASTFDS